MNGSVSDLPTEADISPLRNTYVGPTVDRDHNGAIIPNEAVPDGTTDIISFKFRNGDNRNMRNGTSNNGFPTGNDGDNAVAQANYNLVVHPSCVYFPSHKHAILRTGYNLPENTFLKDIELDVASPGYAVYGNSIDCKWNAPGAFWGDVAGILGVAEDVPTIEEVPGLSALLAVLHIGFECMAETGDHQSVAFAVGASDPYAAPLPWDDPASTVDPAMPKTPTSNKSLYWFHPKMHMLYKRVYSLIDTYTTRGFEGETQNEPLNIKQGPYSFFGFFEYSIKGGS